jgi:hypothetical protein
MNAPPFRAAIWTCLFVVCGTVATAAGAARPDIAPQLRAGDLAAAQKLLADHLAMEKGDDLARFQLGTVQFLRAAERLAQDGTLYGARSPMFAVPFLRLGGLAGKSENPAPITYRDARAMFERFQTSILAAEATLAPIQDKHLVWKLDLRDVRLDLNGDGQRTDNETLGALFQLVAVRPRWDAQEQPPLELVVGFDSADVCWLRGYSHLLSALADIALAYDEERLFELTAHAIFADPQTGFAKRRNVDMTVELPQQPSGFVQEISDLVAFVHLLDFELEEPERLKAAHEHLLAVIELSRKSWQLILAETDNDHEWIPGPRQTSVIPGLAFNREQVAAWQDFLNEAEAILEGKKLIPFWRHGFIEGVNLKRVFLEPRPFDVVLWFQGTAAFPYLETGEQTSRETWERFQRMFRGEFLGVAVWVN